MIMEVEEIEAVLEKIWDLHDKLSDAIHSISRLHFLNSIKNLKSDKRKTATEAVDDNRGFVFYKDLRVDDSDSAIQEAKSLNAIRTALENLEDQLEFYHTVQIQQRAERDTAIARLEQSRIVLAMRLSEHHGKKYKVIEEALAFVGDVHDASRFVSPENLYSSTQNLPGENLVRRQDEGANSVIKVLISGLGFMRKALKLNCVSGMLGNAALFAISMVAFLHLQQGSYKALPYNQEQVIYTNRNARRVSNEEGSSSIGNINHLDVMLGRG